MNIQIQDVNSTKAPAAIGPYSQAIKTQHYLFVSGQIAINPKTGALYGKTIEEQMYCVFMNIEKILLEAKLTLKDIVKVEVFLKDMTDLDKLNKFYTEKFYHKIKPARQVVEVSRLPKDALIEISCIALVSF